MQYLKPKFQGPTPDHINGVSCEACVYGERWAKHSSNCSKYKRRILDDLVEAEVREGLYDRVSGPQLAPGQSFEEFCDLYQRFS
jgi:hypothetical protein